MKRYYAKFDTWFKEGTEAFREEEMFPPDSLTDGETGEKTGSAIYRGIYVIGSGGSYLDERYKEGEEVEMREHCSDDEFLVVEE